MTKYKVWFLYVSVLVISFLFGYFLPTSDIFKGIASMPGVGALCLILYKSWKDEQLQNRQQDFILGTASHMAEVAYDKHVSFCEEYIQRVVKARQELFQDGPSKKAMSIGFDLISIRNKYSSWLTKEIESSLKPFEQALISIGAKQHELESLDVGMQRTKVVGDIYKSFGLVIGNDKPLGENEANLRIDVIIEKIRDILGINVLTKLRIRATELALKRLKE